MSESYTVGGDAWFTLDLHKEAGQTIRVAETHVLEWIDLEIKNLDATVPITIQIFYANAFHEPIGTVLSRDRYRKSDPAWPWEPRRVRFNMQTLTLNAGEYYAIIVTATPGLFDIAPQWQYDAGDATYGRGIRISRDLHTDPWTKYYNDDHMFVEFGQPPAPPSPPDPPIVNVAIVDISWRSTLTGYIISCSTSVPCHLTMYHTTTTTLKHKEPLYRRGIVIADLLRYCFVNYEANDQEEVGDTLYHTFIKEPWPICETRWFTFRASVDSVWSPSTFPIWRLHYGLDQLDFLCTPANRQIRKKDGTWPPVHDSPTGTVLGFYAPPWSRISPGAIHTASKFIDRGYLDFDTRRIPPDLEIVEAELALFFWSKTITMTVINPNFCITQGVHHTPVNRTDYGNQLPYTTIGGQVDIRDIILDRFTYIHFNTAGLGFINPGGFTKLCLRVECEIAEVYGPVGANIASFRSNQMGDDFAPKLTVHFQRG